MRVKQRNATGSSFDLWLDIDKKKSSEKRQLYPNRNPINANMYVYIAHFP